MNAAWIADFSDAAMTVAGQLGFMEVIQTGATLQEKSVASRGLMVVVGLTDGLTGNAVYNMSEEAACQIASKMMCGMEFASADEMVQSAVGELVNMMAGNAATVVSARGIQVNISPPTVVIGSECAVEVRAELFLCVELSLDLIPFEICLAVESA